MSYTGVVFQQRIPRNVDRDALEKKRIDDRGTSLVIQSGSKLGSRLQAASSSNLRGVPQCSLTVVAITIADK